MDNNDYFYNTVREQLKGIEQNTRNIANVLQYLKNGASRVAIGLLVYAIMKHFGFAP